MDEYTQEWETLVTRVPGLSESRLIQSYVSGLKTHLQVELDMHDISSIEVVRQKAKIAQKNFEQIFWSKSEETYSRRRTPQCADAKNTRYVPPHYHENENYNVETQRIKEAKCRCCGEKWDPKHRCAKGKEPKNLYNCEATNDSNSEDSDIEETKDTPEFSPKLANESIPRVLLSAMMGISQPQTLKLQGHIKKNNVVVLIDSGSTHNFLDAIVEKRLNIFSSPLPNMKVMVDDGKKIEKVGKYHKVKL